MRTLALALWGALALAVFIGFVALGNWQLERRVWKHALIDRVQQRVHAPAVPAPPSGDWPELGTRPDDFAYRRVTVRGVFLHEHTLLVQATTVLGRGFWVMTPLWTTENTTVFINRGFVPASQPDGAWRSAPQALGTQDLTPHDASADVSANIEARVTVTGLLRLSEAEGAFLRKNDPPANRWFSRNVPQMGTHMGTHMAARLRNTTPAPALAPYFIDDQARTPLPGLWAQWTLHPPQRLPDNLLPVGGLTVLTFADNHLSYALTWYALALMVALAATYVIRTEWRLRKAKSLPVPDTTRRPV